MKKLLTVVLLVLGLMIPASAMPRSRVLQIQNALNKHGYTIRATGVMDQSTIAALKDYQKSHGWQSRIVPDSRALISLDLGPSYVRLLNPETAWIARADYGKTIVVQSNKE